MKTSEIDLRYLIREMLNEEEEREESIVPKLKSIFSGFSSTLAKGVNQGVSSYQDSWADSGDAAGEIEQIALKNNDSVYETLAKHAQIIYDFQACTNMISNSADRLTQLLSNKASELAVDVSNVDPGEIEAVMEIVDQCTIHVGEMIGYCQEVITKGRSGGKQSVSKKLAKHLKVDSNNTKTLKNLSNFVKELEGLDVRGKWDSLLSSKSVKSWEEKSGEKYGPQELHIISAVNAELLPSFLSEISKLKSSLEVAYGTIESLERLIPEIEKTAISDEKQKAEEKSQEES